MTAIHNQVILLAGASAGMGRQLALLLAARRNRLVLFARRQTELDALNGELQALGAETLLVCGDATREEDAGRCVRLAVEHFGRVDIAVLNVGAGPEQRMSDVSAADINACMDLNYRSLTNFLPPLIRQMRLQQSGLIAHTNSLAGFLGLPLQGPYSAAKAAARLLMDSCRVELEPQGIGFTSIYPGFVRTARVDGYDMPAPFSISEQQGAAFMLQALQSRPADYLFPGPLSWLIRLARVLPKALTTRLLRRAL